MALPTASQVTSVFMYGDETPPENFNDVSLIENSSPRIIEISTEEYMNDASGPGRFAHASQSELVSSFFAAAAANIILTAPNADEFLQDNGDYLIPKADMVSMLGLDGTFYGVSVSQRQMSDEYDDYAERTYIWGGTLFKISDTAVFRLSHDGVKTIENMYLEPWSPGDGPAKDNFDWDGSDSITSLGNDFLKHGVDPSGIGSIVTLQFSEYHGSGVTFTDDDFLMDQSEFAEESSVGLVELFSAMSGIVDQLFNSGTTKTIHENRAIIYGTTGDDSLVAGVTVDGYNITSPTHGIPPFVMNMPLSQYAADGLLYRGAGGDDVVVGTDHPGGDIIYGDSGDDSINGFGGDDVVYGGSGSDVFVEVLGGTKISGGSGDDHFDIAGDGSGSPAIIWGGGGADIVNVSIDTGLSGESEEAIGILVVDIDNVSEDNFHNLTYDMLGMGENFNWSQVDVVLVNPDSYDRINFKDLVGAQQLEAQTIENEQWFYPSLGSDGQETPPQHYTTLSFSGYDGWIETHEWALHIRNPVSDYHQSFLSGYSDTVYGPADILVEDWVREGRRENEDGDFETFVNILGDPETGEVFYEPSILGDFGLGGSGWDGEIDTEYDLSGAYAVSDWIGNEREHYFHALDTEPVTDPIGWFMIGGHLSGSSIAIGNMSGGGIIHGHITEENNGLLI